ncbi:MAG: patatin-like phospholipase family protein, partial [Acidimicrobiales bacterium]
MSEQLGSTAFVLGGGGRWGAVEVGMLRALSEAGVAPDFVVGTSIGAINGAIYCADPTEAGIAVLDELWADADALDFPATTPVELVKNLT